ncbi:hypothetical protein L7F22_021753 [Adiantum nelumboides]|nr:hypothetical protein [Adiantum nelumboides]
MYMHCKNLYEQPNVGKMPCHGSLLCIPSFFTVEDVRGGLKKLATRKAGDLQGFKSEMLKWTKEETHSWIYDMFNLALQHGMPHDWSTNWIKPLHKGRDANNVNNYRTIMVDSLMAKLFGCVMEMKISNGLKRMVNVHMDKRVFVKIIAQLITLSLLKFS